MTLTTRRVSINDHREELIDILSRNFGSGQEQRFDWHYRANPAGEAWGWFAFDERSHAVGTVAVFPRRMFVNENVMLCGQVGGFAVDPSYRSLGPALLLQRATFEPVDSGVLAFCYDCPPHDRGMATFNRLGMRANCEIGRYTLPLRSDPFLKKRLGNAPWTKPLVTTTNRLLAMRLPSRTSHGVEITNFNGRFGDEFSELDTRVSSCGLIRASRSSEELNWRFRQSPGVDPRVLVARRAGELLGFVAFWTCAEAAYVVDLFGVELGTVGVTLLEAAVKVCAGEDICSLHGFCSDDSPLKPLFESFGFLRRERNSRVVAYEKWDRGGKLLNGGVRWTFGHVEEAVSERTDFVAA